MPVTGKKIAARHRGVALLLTFLVISILTILITSLAVHISYQSRFTLMYYNSVCAFNNARSGIIRAQTELLSNPLWGSSTAITYETGNGRYRVKVTPQAAAPGTTVSYWRISSQGENGGVKRALTSWVVKKTSLEYVQWSGSQTHPVYGEAWLSNGESFSGPLHSNGYFSITGNPKFDSPITSGNLGDAFFNTADASYSQGGKKYYDNRFFYHYRTSYDNDAPLPLTADSTAALTGNSYVSPFPAYDSTWKSNASSFYNGSTSLTFLSNGRIQVVSSSGTAVLPDSNITIHVNGDVTVKGTVSGKATVISEGDVHLAGNVKYKDLSADFLGVVSAKNISFDDLLLINVELDGFYAALGGSFSVKNFNTGEPRGTLTIFGSVLEKYGAPVNTSDSSSGTVTTGFVRNLKYDKRCLDVPSWYPRSSTLIIYAFKDENVPMW